MSEDKSVIDKLIQLSKLFKDGFTIAIDNGIIKQSNINKGYVVSYQTIISINLNNNTTKLYQCKVPLNTIVGGWLDKENNIYYIELNTIYQCKDNALMAAKAYKQKTIYDLYTQEVIKVV